MVAPIAKLVELAAAYGAIPPTLTVAPPEDIPSLDQLRQINTVLFPGNPDYITPRMAQSMGAVSLVRGGGSGSFGPAPVDAIDVVTVSNAGGGGDGVPTRAIFEFTGPSGESWSEDFWTNQSVSGGPPVLPPAMVTARLQMLSPYNVWRRVRWVSTDALRLTVITDIQQSGTFPDAVYGSAPRDLAVIMRLQCDGGASRLWWCRGGNLGDWTITGAGIHAFAGGFRARARAFITQMKLAGWGVRRLHATRLVVPNVTNLQSVDGATSPGLAIVSTAGAHGLATGDEVIIYRTSLKDLPGLRGHWTVSTVPTASSFSIPYRVPRDLGPVVTAGFVRKAVYDAILPFQDILPTLQHIGHHDTKETVFGSRGERRAARLRQSP